MKFENDVSDIIGSPSFKNLKFHEKNRTIHNRFIYRFLFVKSENEFIEKRKHVFSYNIVW